MIARREGDAFLVDYEGLWAYTGRRAISTIRRHCEPVACDVTTKLLLFDAEQSHARLSAVPSRASGRRVRRVA